MSSVSSLFIKKGGYFIYNRHGDVITLFFIYTMVRTLEFYGYDDTAFMNAIRKCCPGCHFNIKIDDDGYIHFVNGDELSVKLDIVYDRETGSLCLYDILEGKIVASGQPVAEIFEEMTSGQTFITDAVASESGITFYTSDVMGGSGQTIELPLPTLNIIEGSGIAVSATTAGTMISLDVEIIDTLEELVESLSGISGVIETVKELEETSSAHTEAIETLSADTAEISGNVENLVVSAETLQNDLAQEITDRETAVSAETKAREDADTILQVAIDVEESARTDADAALEQAISDEAAQREAGDDALEQSIIDETAAREGADTYISGAVTAISAVTDDLEPRVAANEQNISGLSVEVQTFQSGLTQEINDRISGDETTWIYVDDKVDEYLSSVTTAVTSAVTDYEGVLSALTAISTKINTLEGIVGTLSSATGSYDGFISPYGYDDVANLLKQICDKLNIEP